MIGANSSELIPRVSWIADGNECGCYKRNIYLYYWSLWKIVSSMEKKNQIIRKGLDERPVSL